jgi:hypothetical protein
VTEEASSGEDTEATEKDTAHVLPDDDLDYPTLAFESGEVEPDGSFDLAQEMDREEMRDWADGLAGALGSHDLGVSTPDGFVTFGVAPEGVETTFEADEDHRGTLEVTFRLSGKAMFVADGSETVVGSRGDTGFVPLSMLSDDRDLYRCYSWIDDPEDPE